ncbi:patatin-like protein [Parasphingorhabdus pacifica]
MTTAGPVKENEQELRLALAMRGGASMAVWIGGAVAEIDRLRRALDDEASAEHPWAGLSALAGYDSVRIDVLAGTSAGGLNATLLSASLVYGMPFETMRETWVSLGDLESMARPIPKFWQAPPRSLLEGDAYFRKQLADVLRENVPADNNERKAVDRADLLLTATLLDPVVEKHFDGRSGPMLEERRTASFRFRHRGRPGQPLSDFGTGKDFDDTVLQLAHAARTTSSFPFAFEPANVHSAPGSAPPGEPDMFGRFSEVATDSGAKPFRVIDGGVLDNIPVTAAIEAMAASPADRPSARWLLYLNPEPEAAEEERPRGRQFALPVASTAVQTRLSQESLLADLNALDEHNRAVARTGLRRRALFAELRSTPADQRHRVLEEQTAAVRRDHAVVRAELDAQEVHRLLTDPDGTGDDDLLPPVLGDPLAGWSAPARSLLGRHLSQCMGERAATDPAEVFDDVRALRSAVQECLGWARDIERWAARERLPEIGRCKTALYRLQAFADVLEGHADRYWVNGARLEPIVDPGELDGWVTRVAQRRFRLQHHLPSPISPLLGAVLAEVDGGARFQRALAEFAGELMSIVDSSGADAVDDDADRVDAVAEATAMLHGLADRLATAAPERTHADEPAQLGYELLEQAEQRLDVLRRLVVLTAPLDVGRAPGTHINLLRVVGDAQTPLPFRGLTRGAERLGTENKIRGGDLGNFGAFLSAKWRANDWMWGRMDAATSLVDLLLDPVRLVRQNSEDGASGVLATLRQVVTRLSSAELGELDEAKRKQWAAFLAELWAGNEHEVSAEIRAMFERPEDVHPLPRTREVVTERLHWTIAAGEIPFVEGVEIGADPNGGAASTPAIPDRLARSVKNYSVGRQRLVDLGEQRTATMATRLGLLACRAVQPRGHSLLEWFGRLGMLVAKPLLAALVLAVSAPRRVAAVAFLAAVVCTLAGASAATSGLGFDPAVASEPGTGQPSTVAVSGQDTGGSGCPPDAFGQADRACHPTGPAAVGESAAAGESVGTASVFDFSGTSGAGFYVAFPLSVVFAVWLSWALIGRGRGLARWLPAALLAAVLLAGLVGAVLSGFRLGAFGMLEAAVVLTWLATFAYRYAGRFAATALTAVVFGAVLLGYSGPHWLVVATVATAYAQMALVGSVDVLRPRPRPA